MTKQMLDDRAVADTNVETPLAETTDALPLAVRRARQFAHATGMPFLCVDAETGAVVSSTADDVLAALPDEARIRLPELSNPEVFEFASGLMIGAVPTPEVARRRTVALCYAFSRADAQPDEITLAAAERNWPQERLDRWNKAQVTCTPGILRALLQASVKQADHDDRNTELQSEIDQLANELENTYEEISLLHALTQNLQISRSPLDVAQLCLERIHSRLGCEGNAICIEDRHGNTQILVEGSLPFDESGIARLIARYEVNDWTRPFVRNRINGSLLGADYPRLCNMVIVPICEGPRRFGWIVSCNLSQNAEYGTVEASLLNSVATILGTHMRNIELYEQHGELMLSFVRSLVSTLDAKDPYTRGHSERVALIARRIGEHLELPPDDLNDIYLSGLLHDVGKVGVDDRILRKPSSLSADELSEIAQHPMIGYSILQGIKNLKRIIPGVRSHHEKYDGTGYPDGLREEEIPLMARVLSVADSYDAMASDRPYRAGMPLEEIENTFHRGAGQQWDRKIIDSYFAVREDIQAICDDYSPTDRDIFNEGRCEA